jgi:hypothetical protein
MGGGCLIHGLAEAAHLGDGVCVGLQGMIGPGFAQLVGDRLLRGGGLLEDAFDWGRRLGGERLSLCHVAWIWETLIHVAMMSKSW